MSGPVVVVVVAVVVVVHGTAVPALRRHGATEQSPARRLLDAGTNGSILE